MIKYAKVENCYAAIRVVHKQFYFTALILTQPLEIVIWHFVRRGLAI